MVLTSNVIIHVQAKFTLCLLLLHDTIHMKDKNGSMIGL